jgi:transcription termination factor NusB
MTDRKGSTTTEGTNKLVEKYLKEVDDDEDSADEEEVSSASATAQSLGVRAQKKILSKLSSKSVAKVFIDETSGRILDNLHKLIRSYSGSKKEADKLLRSIIKTIVKIGILYKNDLFTEYELKFIEDFRHRFHSLSKAIVTFYEVDFTFDRLFLTRMCKECQDLTHRIISTHLTNKSHARMDYVFNYVSNLQFLEYCFNPSSTVNRAIIKEIVEDMHSLMDAGFL